MKTEAAETNRRPFRNRSKALLWAGCAAGFALLHILLNFPTWLHPFTIVRGVPGDNLLFIWNLWWVATDLWELPETPVALCPLVFHPEGLNFIFHSHTWLYGIVYAFLRGLFLLCAGSGGEPQAIVFAYNVFLLWSSTTSGLAIMLLLRECGIRSPLVCFAAAIPVTFCSLRLFSLNGHLNYAGTEFLFAATWAYCAALRRKGRTAWMYWITGGFLGGLAFLNDQTLGIMAGIGGLLAGLVHFRSAIKGSRYTELLMPFSALAVTVLLTGWQLRELLSVFGSHEYVVLHSPTGGHTDVANLLLPPDANAFTGGVASAVREAFNMADPTGTAFAGYALLLAGAGGAVVAIKRRFRGTGPTHVFVFLLGVTGLFLVIGNRLVILGHSVIPMPGAVMTELPGFANVRAPGRFVLLCLACLSVLSALLLQWLGRVSSPWRGAIFVVLFVFLVHDVSQKSTEFRVDVPPVALPASIADVIGTEDVAPNDAVLTLPFSYTWRDGLYHQIQHRRPIVFGTAARLSPRVFTVRDIRPVVNLLLYGYNRPLPSVASAVETAGGKVAFAEMLSEFAERHDTRYILVDEKRLEGAEMLHRVLEQFATERARELEFAVYELEGRDRGRRDSW